MVCDKPERSIEIRKLDDRQRSPGRRYRAVYVDEPDGREGFGDSLLEARLDLQKRC